MYIAGKGTEEVVASADVIVVKADLVRLTGSTTVNTILNPLLLNRGSHTFGIVAVDGAVTVGTSGNILVGQSLAQNRLYYFTWSSAAAKWYIHAVA